MCAGDEAMRPGRTRSSRGGALSMPAVRRCYSVGRQRRRASRTFHGPFTAFTMRCQDESRGDRAPRRASRAIWARYQPSRGARTAARFAVSASGPTQPPRAMECRRHQRITKRTRRDAERRGADSREVIRRACAGAAAVVFRYNSVSQRTELTVCDLSTRDSSASRSALAASGCTARRASDRSWCTRLQTSWPCATPRRRLSSCRSRRRCRRAGSSRA